MLFYLQNIPQYMINRQQNEFEYYQETEHQTVIMLSYGESGLFKTDKKDKLSSDNFVFLCYNTCEFTEYIVNNIQKGELLHEIS